MTARFKWTRPNVKQMMGRARVSAAARSWFWLADRLGELATLMGRLQSQALDRRRPLWEMWFVDGLESGDVGLINQRYILMLFGNNQKLELQPWQAANEMTVSVDKIDWPVDTWYTMKLRVQNRDDGTTLVQGKIWPTAEPEPAAWTVEKVDRIPHRAGAPGLYGDGIADVMFDNFKVYRNQ